MLFACFIIAAARFAVPLDHAELKIQFNRPSKILDKIETLTNANIKADDAHGLLIFDGSAEDIKQAQVYAAMFDVHRRRIGVSVTVESEEDKITYQVSAKLLNNQMWETSDGDTGVSVTVQPRINNDNTVTLYLNYGIGKTKPRQVVVRVKTGALQTFSVGSDEARQTRQRPEGGFEIKSVPVPVPKITIRPEILD